MVALLPLPTAPHQTLHTIQEQSKNKNLITGRLSSYMRPACGGPLPNCQCILEQDGKKLQKRCKSGWSIFSLKYNTKENNIQIYADTR